MLLLEDYIKSPRQELHLRPADYESAALLTKLLGLEV